MRKDRIEYLKTIIKKTYKCYIGERIGDCATLSDVGKFFNIPIDKERNEDYILKDINFDLPSIEIFDKKTNTSYKAEYIYC